MKLSRVIELMENSQDRLRRCLTGLEAPTPGYWPAVLRREAWIHLKRSWDLVRIVWFRDPRTRLFRRGK